MQKPEFRHGRAPINKFQEAFCHPLLHGVAQYIFHNKLEPSNL